MVTNLRLFAAALLAATYSLLSEVQSATISVDCSSEKVQEKIAQAKAGDVIQVSGTCNESVQIASEVVRITLDGQGKAVVQAPQGRDGIFIRGRDIAVRGFTLTGGRDGIHLSGQAAGASAIIENSTIRRTSRHGIHLDQGSIGRIGGNTIEDVGAEGIDLTERSSARVGFIIAEALPNTIRNAGLNAISVSRGSTAKILGNVLTGSTSSGIVVARNAHADIWGNTIFANGGDAIAVSHGGGIVLKGEGMPRLDKANETDASQPNHGFGISCILSGYVDGRLGTLNGKRGDKEIDASCAYRLE